MCVCICCKLYNDIIEKLREGRGFVPLKDVHKMMRTILRSHEINEGIWILKKRFVGARVYNLRKEMLAAILI